MDDQGDVFIHGRVNQYDRFKIENELIYALPIEKLLEKNLKIQEAAVSQTQLG